jgi:hypothetical protein
MIMELKKSRRLAMAAMAAPTPPDPITKIFMAVILAGLDIDRDACQPDSWTESRSVGHVAPVTKVGEFN